jgi:drug/metabolite transporter (DMT)-like permease
MPLDRNRPGNAVAPTPDYEEVTAPSTGRNLLRGANESLIAWSALVVVWVVWGSTYLAIRVGDEHIPPATLAGSRYLAAGLLLYPVALRTGGVQLRQEDRPGRWQWVGCGVVGVLLLVLGNGGVTLAEQRLPSGIAAVLVATVPLWMTLFDALAQRNAPGLRRTVGLLCGLGGVAVLAVGGGGNVPTGPVVIVLVAAASWGFGSVLGRRLLLPRRALLGAAMEMLVGGVVLLVVAACRGEFADLDLGAITATSWFAWAWLIVPGSILAFTAYGYALGHLPVVTVSSYAYVNPVVAVVLGALFVNETLSLREGLGALIIVGSVAALLSRRAAVPPEPAGGPDQADETHRVSAAER